MKEPETTPQEKGSTTYEELRRRNRQEYEDQLSKMPPKTPGAAPFRDSPPIAQKPLPEVPGDTDSISELPAPPPAQAPPKSKCACIYYIQKYPVTYSRDIFKRICSISLY